jgi:ribosome-associated toxin RatA of RatAB toxin-antitoxin module
VHLEHRARIAAPFEAVFALARDIEAWPALLPEYGWCRIIERASDRVTFSMGGWIRGWPARWTAVQEVDLARRRLVFRHLAGITAGMTVEWRFSPTGDGVDVALEHDLLMRWPLVGRWVGDWIVGPIFIDHIARRTLAAVKARAERTRGAP